MRVSDDRNVQPTKKRNPATEEIKVGQLWLWGRGVCSVVSVGKVGKQPNRQRITFTYDWPVKGQLWVLSVCNFRTWLTFHKETPPNCEQCRGAGAFIAEHTDAPPTLCEHCDGTGKEPK